jgi:hypothetical protein
MNKKMVKRMEKWIDEGSQVAVYMNKDLGSPDVGKLAFMKVGGKATYKEAPKRMPDNPTIPIAWRYWLQNTIKRKKDLKKVI